MADEHRLSDSERVENRNVVANSRREVVPLRCLARATIASPRNSDDVKSIGELVCELIERVRVVTQAREQHHRLAGAAPVQDLESDVRRNCDEARLVRRRVEATDVVRRFIEYRWMD